MAWIRHTDEGGRSDELSHPCRDWWTGRRASDRSLLTTAWRLRDDVRLHQVLRRAARLVRRDTGPAGGDRAAGRAGLTCKAASPLASCNGTWRLGDLLAVPATTPDSATPRLAEQVLPVAERIVKRGFLVT